MTGTWTTRKQTNSSTVNLHTSWLCLQIAQQLNAYLTAVKTTQTILDYCTMHLSCVESYA